LSEEQHEKRGTGNIKDKVNIAFLLSISSMLVTLDLYTTRIGLALPNTYEIAPLGNNPFIEYPVIVGLTLFMYLWEKHFRIRHLISFIFPLLIILPIINNILIIIK
jgi:heme/copper-type cytochrome/quinol oxidase subunit 4